MKTTIYKLLGMIKDNKAPKKILFDNQIWNYRTRTDMEGTILFEEYINEETDEDLFDEYLILDILSNEVKILETTITYKQDADYLKPQEPTPYEPYTPPKDDKIEKVDEPYESCIFKTDYEFATELEKKIIDNIELIRKKQDEIIDKMENKL